MINFLLQFFQHLYLLRYRFLIEHRLLSLKIPQISYMTPCLIYIGHKVH